MADVNQLSLASMRVDAVCEWILKKGFQERRFTDSYRKALVNMINKYTYHECVEGIQFISVNQLDRILLKTELAKMQCEVTTYHQI